jgi:hypothetical protein
MKSDLNDLKKLTLELIQTEAQSARDQSKFDKKNIWFKENDMRSILRKNLVHR